MYDLGSKNECSQIKGIYKGENGDFNFYFNDPTNFRVFSLLPYSGIQMEGRFDDGSCKEGKIFFDSEWLYSFKFDYKTCEVEFIDKERKSYFAVRQDCGYSKY